MAANQIRPKVRLMQLLVLAALASCADSDIPGQNPDRRTERGSDHSLAQGPSRDPFVVLDQNAEADPAERLHEELVAMPSAQESLDISEFAVADSSAETSAADFDEATQEAVFETGLSLYASD